MRRASLLVLFLTVFIDLIGFGMVIPFLSFYAREYGASGTAVGAVVGIYSIMQFVFAPIWGRVSDRIGRRPVLLSCLIASTSGYLLFAFAHSLALLFASRIIAGVGGASIATAQAYIADSTTPENRAKGMGLIGAAFGLGFILGPPLSGILANVGGSMGLHGNLLPGLVAAALSFTAFLIGLVVLAESKPASLVPTSGLPPQFDLRLWKQVRASSLMIALLAGLFLTLLAVSGMEVNVTFHGRDRFGFRQLDMAYFFLYMGVIVAAIQGGLIGKLVNRFGERRVIIAGAACFTAGFLLIPSVWKLPMLYLVATLIAIGQGLCYPALTALVSKVSPQNERGSMLGLATSAGSLARFLGPIIAGAMYDWGGARGGFYGGGAFMALALFVAVRMRTERIA
jgi:DHA1 family tetracycline resistance protein-like MFS transporter